MTICGDCLIELDKCQHAGEYQKERARKTQRTINDVQKELGEEAVNSQL